MRSTLTVLALLLCTAAAARSLAEADEAASLLAIGPVNLTNCYTFSQLFGFPSTYALEITNAINYTQLGSFPTQNYTFEEFYSYNNTMPWIGGDGEVVYNIPAYDYKCWNTSVPTYDWATCDGAAAPGACIKKDIELFGATWMELGQLLCTGSYPSAGADLETPIPSPGNVTYIMSSMCAQYTYSPYNNNGTSWYYMITDEFGEQYAMQTLEEVPKTDEEWEALMAGQVLPPGWTLSKQELAEPEIHYSYLYGPYCLQALLIDNLNIRYHQLTWNVPFADGLLGNMDCQATGAVPSNVINNLKDARAST